MASIQILPTSNDGALVTSWPQLIQFQNPIIESASMDLSTGTIPVRLASLEQTLRQASVCQKCIGGGCAEEQHLWGTESRISRWERWGNYNSVPTGASSGSVWSPGAKMTFQSCPKFRLRAEVASSHWQSLKLDYPKKGHNLPWVRLSFHWGRCLGRHSTVSDRQTIKSPSRGGKDCLSFEGENMGLHHRLHFTFLMDQRIKGKGRVIQSSPRKAGKQAHSEVIRLKGFIQWSFEIEDQIAKGRPVAHIRV